jgi:hypothetical protein
VRGASHYIRVCRTPESGLLLVCGNSKSGSFGIYPVRRHLGSPAVALELRSTEVDGQGLPRKFTPQVGTHTKVERWRALIDYPNPAYLCMTVRGGIPADLSDGVGQVYNLCRV